MIAFLFYNWMQIQYTQTQGRQWGCAGGSAKHCRTGQRVKETSGRKSDRVTSQLGRGGKSTKIFYSSESMITWMKFT